MQVHSCCLSSSAVYYSIFVATYVHDYYVGILITPRACAMVKASRHRCCRLSVGTKNTISPDPGRSISAKYLQAV